MTREPEDLRAALARVAWMADAGRQFFPGKEQVMREMFAIIRDYAKGVLANHK